MEKEMVVVLALGLAPACDEHAAVGAELGWEREELLRLGSVKARAVRV